MHTNQERSDSWAKLVKLRFKTAVFLTFLFLLACTPTLAPLPTRAVPAMLPSPLPTEAFSAVTAIPTITAVSPTPPPTPTAEPCQEAAEMQTISLPSTIAGELAVRIFLPPCYAEDGYVYPVLFMLPGNIHDETFWDEIGLDETASHLIAENQMPPLVIVMPDGGPIASNTSGGPDSYEAIITDELLTYIETMPCIWNRRDGRAIGGVSRGGYWALEIAFRHPHLFTSVGGHSASLLDTTTDTAINPQITGINSRLKDLRIYLDIGENDGLRFPLLQLHEEMLANGIEHHWSLNAGTHDNAYWTAHLADYLHWYSTPWPQARSHYPTCEK